jgi:hypothetical protein
MVANTYVIDVACSLINCRRQILHAFFPSQLVLSFFGNANNHKQLRFGASRNRHGGAIWLDFAAPPHEHMVVDVTVTSWCTHEL